MLQLNLKTFNDIFNGYFTRQAENVYRFNKNKCFVAKIDLTIQYNCQRAIDRLA